MIEGLQTSGLPTLRDQAALAAYQAAALAAAKAKAQPGAKSAARGVDAAATGAPASPFAAPAAQAAGKGETALALYGRQDHVTTVRASALGLGLKNL